MLDLAKRCKQLESHVHISTCYVNSNFEGWIDEKLYDLGFDPEEVLKQVSALNTSQLEKVTVTGILRDWPNTYTFTKAMAECLIQRHKGSVPVAIVRPSIVGASWKEPVPGWVDVISAAGAIYMSAGLGVLKMLPGKKDAIADLVPVDYVANTVIGAAAAISRKSVRKNVWRAFQMVWPFGLSTLLFACACSQSGNGQGVSLCAKRPEANDVEHGAELRGTLLCA